MLKHGEINPLNVFGLRQLEHCPPHFHRVVFDMSTNEKRIRDWIYENLEGRFWLGDVFEDAQGSTVMHKCAAFEEHGESTYFSLLLDTINNWEYRPFR